MYTSQKARTRIAYLRRVSARRPGPSSRKARPGEPVVEGRLAGLVPPLEALREHGLARVVCRERRGESEPEQHVDSPPRRRGGPACRVGSRSTPSASGPARRNPSSRVVTSRAYSKDQGRTRTTVTQVAGAPRRLAAATSRIATGIMRTNARAGVEAGGEGRAGAAREEADPEASEGLRPDAGRQDSHGASPSPLGRVEEDDRALHRPEAGLGRSRSRAGATSDSAYQGDRAKARRHSAPASELPAKRRAWFTRPPRAPIARDATSAPKPSAATRSPSAAGPIRSTSRAKTGSICWYGKTSVFMRIVTTSTPRMVGWARTSRSPEAMLARTGSPPGVPGRERCRSRRRAPARAPEREPGEDGIAGARAEASEKEPAKERPDHLRALHRHALQRDDGRQALPTRDGEEHGPPRREIEHPGDTERRPRPRPGRRSRPGRAAKRRASVDAAATFRIWTAIITRTRGRRSASTPAKGPSSIMGAARQNAATPTIRGESVRARASQPRTRRSIQRAVLAQSPVSHRIR